MMDLLANFKATRNTYYFCPCGSNDYVYLNNKDTCKTKIESYNNFNNQSHTGLFAIYHHHCCIYLHNCCNFRSSFDIHFLPDLGSSCLYVLLLNVYSTSSSSSLPTVSIISWRPLSSWLLTINCCVIFLTTIETASGSLISSIPTFIGHISCH